MSTGLVLFAHGARDPRWAGTVEALASRIAHRSPGVAVAPAYLEFMAPDLAGAIDAMVARGVRCVVVAPVFLAAGGHVLRDLPDRLAGIAARHPGLSVRVEPALGSLPEVVEAMADACLRTLERASAPPRNGAHAEAGAHEKGVDGPTQLD
jgi:sirohydrochlorin cobaltochelatase